MSPERLRSHSSLVLPIFILSLLILGGSLSAGRRSAAAMGSGIFTDSGQTLGNDTTQGVSLGDLDGQNGPDAFTAINGANRVWLNNGGGGFRSNGQSLSNLNSQDVALGELDGANGLDALVANSNGASQIWLNDGSGQFSAGEALGSGNAYGVALGDLDGDGDLDAFLANNGANSIMINDGGDDGGMEGEFTDSGQTLGSASSYGVALGDLDGDDDLDAFVANNGANKVWINDGGDDGGTEGEFTDSGQALGSTWSYDVALGDLDGDGDLDAYSASWFPNANEVWINQGGIQAGTQGEFSAGGALGSNASLGVALGDLDDVASLDAFVANNIPAGARVWLNDGSASFSDSGQSLASDTTSYDVALDDLDGDGDLDAFLASFGPDLVFFNGDTPLPNAVFNVARETNDDGDEITYHTGAGDAMLPVMLDVPAPVNLDVHVDIDGPTTTSEIMSFSTGEQVHILQLVNPDPDPSETYELTLSVTVDGGTPVPANQSDQLLLAFIDSEQGMEECILCYVEWLVRLLGFDPTFGAMHHIDISGQEDTLAWAYYTATFDAYSPELATIVATNPAILFESLALLESWTPVAQGMGDSGSTALITQDMVDDGNSLADDIEAQASAGLQTFLAHEQTAVDGDALVGMNAEAAWAEVESQRNFSALFLTIVLNESD